jgi:hypothetical protein
VGHEQNWRSRSEALGVARAHVNAAATALNTDDRASHGRDQERRPAIAWPKVQDTPIAHADRVVKNLAPAKKVAAPPPVKGLVNHGQGFAGLRFHPVVYRHDRARLSQLYIHQDPVNDVKEVGFREQIMAANCEPVPSPG